MTGKKTLLLASLLCCVGSSYSSHSPVPANKVIEWTTRAVHSVFEPPRQAQTYFITWSWQQYRESAVAQALKEAKRRQLQVSAELLQPLKITREGLYPYDYAWELQTTVRVIFRAAALQPVTKEYKIKVITSRPRLTAATPGFKIIRFKIKAIDGA